MTATVFFLLVLIAFAWSSLARMLGEYTWNDYFAMSAAGFLGALAGHRIAVALNWPVVFGLSIGNDLFPLFWVIVFSGVFVAVLGVVFRRGSRQTPEKREDRNQPNPEPERGLDNGKGTKQP